MSEGALWSGCLALLLVGASLMLWAEAVRRREREASRSFVRTQTEQINARYQVNAQSVPSAVPDSLHRAWHDALRRADLEPGRRLYLLAFGPLAVIALVAWAVSGLLSAVTAILLYALVAAFLFWSRTRRMNERLMQQLPGFLDGVVRLMSIGSAVPAAFQAASANTEPPLRTCLALTTQLQRAGKDLDAAVLAVGQLYRVNELVLLSSVLRLALRYGGRADIVMERTAAFMRDREQAQKELLALSAETRLSAWILGLLPVVVGGIIIMFNATYVMSMWRDPVGKMLMMAAFGLEVMGSLMLARLAKAI
ncbi:membrane protein [Ralstonia solanacearum]|uniref:type II secretion system F family protein n=1 Tax=Ralstonia solanacearum TaxID=305 RepID=UPI00070A59D6|nr:type II secretion system F family protein [Ralstonia solanacearum]AYB54504.1 type II secretion system F family protein [Ralstonia solanacearum]AYB59051.1 type II secretion system F family protein [Ralstonia solanacearum]MBB6593273.1 type II secretion system F family protein [Ralstonia solanacearum]MBB6597498.1 type II secretion system F family protein [Ralstonia solanacearum]MDB0511032.1 type II secretion system F family protein [Ralstonia solanacearum]